KARDYFIPKLEELHVRLTDHRKSLKSETKVKAYKKELEKLEEPFTNQIRQIIKLVLLIQKVNNNKVLSKQDLRATPIYQAQKVIAAKKKDKTLTAEITFKLYKEGKSISEIAKERGFVESTIESHLSQYVENGAIPIQELVNEKRVEKIMKALSSDAVGLGEIKSKLPKDYSYGEIKLVMAHSKIDS
ncbi:MAG: helix-turn-helix domain-containing protein, partial [Bacteroidota bacterium]